MLLTAPDVGYVAGIIDTIALLRVRETPDGTLLPSVAVSTPNLPLLIMLGDMTGTTPFVTRRTYDKHRCQQHCEQAHDHVMSRSARWSVTGVRATMLLHDVTPLLRLQRDAAQELLDVGLSAPRKQATVVKMQRLGWSVPDDWSERKVRAEQGRSSSS